MNMRSSLVSVWREYRSLALFILLMVIFRSALADWNTVPTGSMRPTIVEGDRIFVNKLAYDLKIPFTSVSVHRIASPLRGDIVVFESKAADTRLVKRVIGLPGETVEMRDNRLIINGISAQYSGVESANEVATYATETYFAMTHRIELASSGGSRLGTFGPVMVPGDSYLVLGDNRDNSADSRVYGFIPRHEIVGRATRIVLSLDYDHYFIPRFERSFRVL